jgi:hypothetical protein
MYRRMVLLERKNNELTSMATLLVAHFFHLPLTTFDLLSSSINLL